MVHEVPLLGSHAAQEAPIQDDAFRPSVCGHGFYQHVQSVQVGLDSNYPNTRPVGEGEIREVAHIRSKVDDEIARPDPEIVVLQIDIPNPNLTDARYDSVSFQLSRHTTALGQKRTGAHRSVSRLKVPPRHALP